MLIPLLPFFYVQLFTGKSSNLYENALGGLDRLYSAVFELSFRQVKTVLLLFAREGCILSGHVVFEHCSNVLLTSSYH